MACVFLLTCISLKLLVQTQGQNIHPAKIYSQNNEVPEGGKLEVKCSTFGFTANSVYLYLCHNGKAVNMIKQCNLDDVIFTIESIGKDYSGNYSCVFSEDILKITNVMGYGHNYIFIRVTESLVPAQISLLKSEVAEGRDIEFNCSTLKPLNINQSRMGILAFLIKNGTTIQVNIWDTNETMTTFTLRNVRFEDAGAYSCVIMLNILPHPEKRIYGHNEVNLQITAAPVCYNCTGKVRIAIVCFILLLFISLILGIWAVFQMQDYRGFHKSERCLDNEEQLQETEIIYEETDDIDVPGEKQSACNLWDEFSDSEEDQEVNECHPDMVYNYATARAPGCQTNEKVVCDV